jgi:uncharacterized membrane protein
MGLMVLVLGLILFLGPHVLLTMRPQRAAVVKRLGEWPYKGLFAALSIAGLYVTGKGFGMYETAGPLVLWTAPAWTRHITEALMLPACIFVAAAYLPGSIKLALKHPMLVGVKTWAVAHLLVNGADDRTGNGNRLISWLRGPWKDCGSQTQVRPQSRRFRQH